MNISDLTFPSPYGDYGSYRRPAECLLLAVPALFPSPYGDYGSYHSRAGETKVGGHCFRPLTGIMVLINPQYNHSVGIVLCFRPLTGIMVLIRTPYKWLHSAIENAFCGADFLFSSFFTFLWKMIFKNRPIADF